MKYSTVFSREFGCSTPDAVFEKLLDTLSDSIKGWDYLVNWEKVIRETRSIEMDLHTLNYLVGKDNMEQAFTDLLKQHPQIGRLIPGLLACRDTKIKIFTGLADGQLRYEDFDFRKTVALTDADIKSLYQFASNCGLLKMFKDKRIKFVPDYVFGVEVGLDSNGRKNRGGNAMEGLVETLIALICTKHNNLKYLSQATASKIRTHWNIEVKVVEKKKANAERIFDFAIRNGQKLCLIETNYYGGGGSKLKATAGEYQTLFSQVSAQGHSFIWITDGLGWRKTKDPLREAFEKLDYILNLNMVLRGILETILVNL